MAGRFGEVNYDAIPSVIYCYPEVAAVGLTEQQAKERDIPYCIGTYPFLGSGPGPLHGPNRRPGQAHRPRQVRPRPGGTHHQR